MLAVERILKFALLSTFCCMYGCTSETSSQPPEARELTTDLPSNQEKTVELDCVAIFNQMKERLNAKGWSLAPTPATWSTFRVDYENPFTPSIAEDFWSQWSAVETGLTNNSNAYMRKQFDEVITEATKNGSAEREFTSSGFTVNITAENGELGIGQFVNVSFMGTKFVQ